MRVCVAPASPRTGRATIRALLQDPSSPSVVGVYRDLTKVPRDLASHPRFECLQGDVSTRTSLDFRGVDAVVTISPPQYSGKNDPIEASRINAENVRSAIVESGSVKRVVYISSEGAEHDRGTGEIATNHVAETALRDVVPEVVFVRCAYFMHNWNVPTLQGDAPVIYSPVSPADFQIDMIASMDIGDVCARKALEAGEALSRNPYVFNLVGPRSYSPNDVQQALAEVLAKDVRLEVVPIEGLGRFFSSFLPPSLVHLFVEMTESFHPGGVIYENPPDPETLQKGTVSLAEGLAAELAS